jgi:hypothetical protein
MYLESHEISMLHLVPKRCLVYPSPESELMKTTAVSAAAAALAAAVVLSVVL